MHHVPWRRSRPTAPAAGLTLIEMMVVVALLGIVVAIALPNYSAHVQRSRVPVAFDALNALFTRMEQRFQDTGAYACPASTGTAGLFTVSCEITNSGAGYLLRATGSGAMAGYTYSLNHRSQRQTEAHPKGVPTTACWSTRGTLCDQ